MSKKKIILIAVVLVSIFLIVGHIDYHRHYYGHQLKILKNKLTLMFDEKYQAPEATAENISNFKQTIANNLIYIEGGDFIMGDFQFDYIDSDGKAYKEWALGERVDERKEVTLPSFYMSAYETSYYEFELFLNATDRDTEISVNRRNGDYNDGNMLDRDYPADISWAEATAFCEWTGEQVGVPMSLPTEAQWEYAARSRGRDVAYATNDGSLKSYINIYGFYKDRINWGGEKNPQPRRGEFPPNPLGLYDMTGSLSEWVLEVKSDVPETPRWPRNKEEKPYKVERGSYWGQEDAFVTVAKSKRVTPIETYEDNPQIVNAVDAVLEDGETMFYTYLTGVRCVANLELPPSQSGIGKMAGAIPENFPQPVIWKELKPWVYD